MKRWCAAVLMAVILAAAGSAAMAADYFVATWGNDGNPGTIDLPFRTITQGTTVAQAGDTINVRAGEYAEGRLDFYRDGAPGAPITLVSYDGDHAAHVTDGVYIHDRRYIRLIGMQISGSTNALHIDPSTDLSSRSGYIDIFRCYVHSPGGGDVVKVNQSDYVTLEDCLIGGASGDEQCDWVWVNYSVARRCYFYDFNAYAFTQKGGSRYNVLEDSVIYHGLDTYARCTRFGGSTDRKYRDPTTTYATEYGVYRNNIMREGPDGATGTFECWYAYFYNNTVHNCGTPDRGIVIHHADPKLSGDGGSRHLFFFNNIFMDTDGDMGSVVHDQSGKPYEDWQHDNNNYWNAGNPIPTTGLYDPNLEPNSTFGNPNLANPLGTASSRQGWIELYRPTAASTLVIDRGNSNAGNDPRPAVHADIEGTPRPQGAGWDIGALEYASGPVPPVANFSGNPTSGYAPLTVYFSDLSTGGPTSWSWTFGDGGNSPLQNPSHDYLTPNTYTVSLTAQNAYGQDTETKPNYISVSSAPTTSCHVGSIVMANGGTPGYKASATVTVHDQDCAPLAGVTVAIAWSGATSGTDSGVTNGSGQVTFTSSRNKAGGTFTCCVTDLSLSGYPYDSPSNHETCDSITLP
jgi:PKD repeat protein